MVQQSFVKLSNSNILFNNLRYIWLSLSSKPYLADKRNVSWRCDATEFRAETYLNFTHRQGTVIFYFIHNLYQLQMQH